MGDYEPSREAATTAKLLPRESNWTRTDADEVGDVLVTAMALGGVSHLFFTSGSDILLFQEAVAKAQAQGRPTPSIVTVMNEQVALNAALGYAMVSGRPAATAVHVDIGTLNYGNALHTAGVGGFPVLAIAGSPATSYPGTHKGSRDHWVQWIQEQHDQRELTRAYSKWQWRLEMQDNPGLIVSRALQAALAPPPGLAFLTVPREVGMAPVEGGCFPTVEQLGIIRPSGPDPDAIDELATWLLEARTPVIITGTSGRDPASVSELVRVVELTGAYVVDQGTRDRLNFPTAHPLFGTAPPVAYADAVVVLDRRHPWVPVGGREIDALRELPDDPRDLPFSDPLRAPMAECRIAWIAHDPAVLGIPVFDFEAELRIASDPRLALRALADAIEDRITDEHRARASERLAAAAVRKQELAELNEQRALAAAHRCPIAPRWLARGLSKIIDDESILLDESMTGSSLLRRYCHSSRPGSYFQHGGSGGGWATGAAIGAKLAEPDRDVVVAAGDGFYAFGMPAVALWTSIHYEAPYLAVVWVNGQYSTGATQVSRYYPGGYAEAAGFPGGRFDPPPDFAAEARAAGAHGETVIDPDELDGALARGLDAVRHGQPAVVAVRVATE
jgi:acetolactate synthase I/II/III large subunit